MDAIELSLFANRISAVCREMGAVLRRSAFSPNIRDRLDYSSAIFDAEGELVEQAAAIPVHLGSMAYAMHSVVRGVDWKPGHQLLLNDPFRGGTHLPDVTAVAPIFHGEQLVGFAANRAHHADIGCESPGSMPLSRSIEDEGLLIPPTLVSTEEDAALNPILEHLSDRDVSRGDLWAQFSANRTGVERILEMVGGFGLEGWEIRTRALNAYAERLCRDMLDAIPDGSYRFRDWLEGDEHPIELALRLTIDGSSARVDFAGTSGPVAENLNCPVSVTAAGVHYVFRCLMPEDAPRCAGAMRPIRIEVPSPCLLDARYPSPVAAGNVETSMRVVDVLCGALAQAIPEAIPAAGQGTMNNLAMGSRAAGGSWNYYETLAGGAGASATHDGASAVHTHMTNTLNTPVEVVEHNYPLRVREYAVRWGSGGSGRKRGGDGLVREYEFLAPARVTLMADRRQRGPWGVAGADAGVSGLDRLEGEVLPGRCAIDVEPANRLRVETPGGGGYGKPR